MSLQNMPERDKPPDSMIYVHSEYHYLACEHYRIFCLPNGDTVKIIRILPILQNCMRVLFE